MLIQKQTLVDALNAEKFGPCVCKREKAIFFCKEKSCPSHISQPLYCLFCYEEEKHPDHKLIRANKELQDWDAKWQGMWLSLSTL